LCIKFFPVPEVIIIFFSTITGHLQFLIKGIIVAVIRYLGHRNRIIVPENREFHGPFRIKINGWNQIEASQSFTCGCCEYLENGKFIFEFNLCFCRMDIDINGVGISLQINEV
jgi:hypothetical protein